MANQFQRNKSLRRVYSPHTMWRTMTVTLSPGEAHTFQMIEAWAREQTFICFSIRKASTRCLMSFLAYNTHDLLRSIVCNFTQISSIYFTARHGMCEEIRVK